jgi:hypothetical protein
MVQRRNISYATQTLEGTQAWDTFMSLVAILYLYIVGFWWAMPTLLFFRNYLGLLYLAKYLQLMEYNL